MPQAIDEAGNIFEVDEAGNVIGHIGSAQQSGPQPITLGRPDPGKQAKTAKDQIEASTASATQSAVIAKATAEAEKAVLEIEGLRQKAASGGLTADEANSFKAKMGTLNALTDQVNRVQQLYESSQQGNPLFEYLPLPGNRQFDAASSGLSQLGTAAFRVPGQGSQSDFEAKQFMDANQPSSWSMDAANQERLNTIRNRVDTTRSALGLPPADWMMGGAPAKRTQDGVYAPAGSSHGGNPPPGGPNPVTSLGGPGAGPLATSADQFRWEADPSLTGLNDAVGAMLRSGASADEVQGFLRARGHNGADPTILNQWIDFYKANQGRNVKGSVDLEKRAVPLSQMEKTVGDVASNPFGAEVANYVNASLFGLPQYAMQPGAMDQIKDNGFSGGLTGDILGAMTGTGALGKAGAMTLGKVAPVLMRGGTAANVGRNVATDVAYGTSLGGAQGDASGGALAGAAGSLGGQALGGTLGALMKGGGNATAKYLRAKGVPLTVGQAVSQSGTLGRVIKSTEDAMTSLPIAGPMIHARRMEGVGGFNTAAMNEGLSPIGARVTAPGNPGIGQAQRAVDDAYDNAVSGVSLTPDQQFIAEMQAAKAAGDAADAARGRRDFGFTMDNKVRPLAGNSPTMTGEALQDMLRTLRGQSKAYNKAATGAQPDPMAASVADAFDGVSGTIQGLAGRVAPDVMPALNSANAAYRNLGILEDATLRGNNTDGLFTPAQLGMATKASEFVSNKAMAAGKAPFAALQRAGQNVLPSTLADSGTATRAFVGGGVLGLPTVAGAGMGFQSGGANDAASGAGGGLATGVGSLALLSALSTKRGQKALVSALLDRPAAAKAAGKKIGKRKGLFGSATVPLLLPQGN